MNVQLFSSYDPVAEEYYDSEKHPTCANFRYLSERFFLENFDAIRLGVDFERPIIETGCGKSIIAPVAEDHFPSFPQLLTLQDQSEKMLEHSLRWQNRTSEMLVCDARNLPHASNHFSAIFSFLADPYNDGGLWDEVSRVLSPGGIWLTTLPSHRWTRTFRTDSDLGVSRFIVNDTKEIDLPSLTYPPHHITQEMSSRGFDLITFKSYYSKDIKGNVSRKLLLNEKFLTVLECYIFQKSF